MSHIKRTIFLFILLFGSIIPYTSAVAQTQAVDQRCFTSSQCVEQRSKFVFDSEGQGDAGFVQNDETGENCELFAQDYQGEEVGYCLAGGNIETTYSFFGKRSFVSIGDFIRHLYSVSISIATILAVIVLIVSGIQRMTAAGNSSVVEGSTKRIIGALSGLALLAFSYVLLNQINPALVNLKQPDIFMLNSVAVTTLTTPDGAVICDPDKTEAENECTTSQICAPVDTGIDMPACQVAALLAIAAVPATVGAAQVGATVAATNITGTGLNITAGASFSRLVGGLISRGLAVLKRVVLPARLRVPGAQIFQGAAVSTFNLAHIGGRVLLQGYIVNGTVKTTQQVSELTGVGMAEIKDYFENEIKGICVEKVTGNFQRGDICHTTLSECGNGLTCIADPVIQGNLACWTGESNLGFCSSGEDGSICNTDDDCSGDNICLDLDRPGTVADGKRCTSGGEGAYCNETSDCGVDAGGNQGICRSNICTYLQVDGEFDLCQTTANCSDINTGFFGASYACFRPGATCGVNTINNSLGEEFGVCLKRKGSTSGPNYKNDIYTADEDSTGAEREFSDGTGRDSLFRYVVTLLESRQEPMTFTGCRSANDTNWLRNRSSSYITVN